MPAVRHVLAIDLGTSGPKVALISERGAVAAAAARPVSLRLTPPRAAEQDPAEVWTAIRAAVHEVLAQAAVPRDAIVAAACTSQYFSIVPVDATGAPTAHMLMWMDGRGGRYAAEIYGRHPEAFMRWVDVHGIPPLPSGADSLSKMLWLQHEQPEVWERSRWMLEPVDWILLRLTGRATANICTAFSMLLTDCRRLDRHAWDAELTALAGIDPAKLPELVPPNSVIGTLRPAVAAELGLDERTVVLSGTNDSQAAAIATATFRPGAAAVNIGTTGQVLAHLAERRNAIDKALVSMPSPVGGRYMVMAENGLAAKALDHFLQRVVFADDPIAAHAADTPFAGLEDCLAATQAGAGGVLCLPWLTGTVAPDGNPRVRGAFVNVSLETGRADLVRAILEGVAYSIRWLLPEVEALAGADACCAELRFSGGGARSLGWAQILADVLGRPILPLADPAHANNRASALLACDALGLAALADVDRFCPVRARVDPRPAAASTYEPLFAQFRAAHGALVPVFDALNGSADEARHA
jgi:xylulokinase